MKQRYTRRESVQGTCVLSCEGLVGQAQVIDLSVPGCRVNTSMTLKAGQYADMVLSFPSSHRPLQVNLAAVRWVKNGQAGLELIRMSEMDQTRLRWLTGSIERWTPQRNWSERMTG